jgi:hypothetical protein
LQYFFQEAKQILNVKENVNVEELTKNYQHLFEVNDKAKEFTFSFTFNICLAS